MPRDLYSILENALKLNASDVHLSAGNLPALRVDGYIQFDYSGLLTKDEVEEMIRVCLSPEKYEEFLKTGDIDSSFAINEKGRFRVNVFMQRNGSTLVLRLIKTNIPEIGELNLPESINKIFDFKEGLVLVTGPTGCGKSTTLAAIINELNKTKKAHIITIEEPIEYIQNFGTCVINQREIGSDSASYARALKSALREDPDIILAGEMRDLESISMVLTAAETGHLVFSTLHTSGAAKTIDRLVDVFPHDQQPQIRAQLSLVLKSVISQRLLPRADNSGRIAAFETMFVNNAIGNLIREAKTANINQIIQTCANDGMILLEKSISNLYYQRFITKETAIEYNAVLGKDLNGI